MKIENILARVKTKPFDSRLQMRPLKLTTARTKKFFEGLPEGLPKLASTLSNQMWLVKVEPAIAKGRIDVKAIRAYLGELNANVNSTIERGENPYLLIKKIFSDKRGVHEYEVVFMGSRHIEKLSYYETHPKTWKSWGEIVFTPEQIRQMIALLESLLEA